MCGRFLNVVIRWWVLPCTESGRTERKFWMELLQRDCTRVTDDTSTLMHGIRFRLNDHFFLSIICLRVQNQSQILLQTIEMLLLSMSQWYIFEDLHVHSWWGQNFQMTYTIREKSKSESKKKNICASCFCRVQFSLCSQSEVIYIIVVATGAMFKWADFRISCSFWDFIPCFALILLVGSGIYLLLQNNNNNN